MSSNNSDYRLKIDEVNHIVYERLLFNLKPKSILILSDFRSINQSVHLRSFFFTLFGQEYGSKS